MNDLTGNEPTDPPSNLVTQRANTSQFVEFVVDEQRYAFPIEQIREIVILQSITPTPQVAAYVDGVSNLRGSIIPIVNLRPLFGLPRRPTDADTRTIVVRVGHRTMGCTVDMVSQVLRVADDQIQPAPETVTADGANYIAGFAKVDENLVVLLDVNELLDVRRLPRGNETKSLPTESLPPGAI